MKIRLFILFLSCFVVFSVVAQNGFVSGIVRESGGVVDFATVYLKGTNYGCMTDEKGVFEMAVPKGEYLLVVSAVGYETTVRKVVVVAGETTRVNVPMKMSVMELEEVEIVSSGVSRVRNSAFTALAVDTRDLQNSTKSLGDALAKTPGLKLRESGGVGSDMNVMLDGFSGKHVKVFIDGVPQEGVGGSFGLNNIPVNFAERIEVYKGVVPVTFGADAIGGVINIVTKKSVLKRQNWFLDAAYSYGSFNTHKSYVNFGQTLKNGFSYEVNAFQNYSDNNYWIDAAVEDFETGRIDKTKKERVQRFNDTYHNEAVVAKVGLVGKSWADRLMFGFTFSNMYKDIQTGVRQDVVYGDKHRRGYSLMPSLEYRKRDLIVKGLDVVFTANYNNNISTNIDTSGVKYNWLAETKQLNSPGEQSLQHTRMKSDNWSATLSVDYRLGEAHKFTVNHVMNAFDRENTSLLATEAQTYAIGKQTVKNITGLAYRLMLSKVWNVSAFGKYYHQYVAGPMATDANQTEFVRTVRQTSSLGYGVAGTYFIIDELQLKASYEKAYRLPTIEEMFGDEDLEMGDIGIKPENSDNMNFNIAYNKKIGEHQLYAEAGFVYRNTKDYIQRNIADLSGGKVAATYINYGKVETLGYNLSVRYGFGRWVSIGANFSQMDVRDNMKTMIGTTMPNIGYRQRMPNLPYLFADGDVTFTWHDLFGKGNVLTVSYDNQYLHEFSFYSSVIGSNKGEYMVPSQFSHNLAVAYSFAKGRYNVSVECRNFTDEKLYDNFSLQKAGRAFYGKFRICFK